jgi:predicted MPP superfamily phosphohydrolase
MKAGSWIKSVLLTLVTLGAAAVFLALLIISAYIPGDWTANWRLFVFLLVLLSLGLGAVNGARALTLLENLGQTAGETPISAPKITRRAFLKALAVEAAFGGVAMAVPAYAHWGEPNLPQITHVEVPVPGLDPRLEGLRIAQLSDFHLSDVVTIEQVRRAVNLARSLTSDLIVLTGDYVTGLAGLAGPCARELSSLHAPYGVHAILGNHDHWTDAGIVAEALADEGLPVMRNDSRRLTINGADLWLAGLDDVWEEKADLEAALRGVPASATVILLVHEPDFADRLGQPKETRFLEENGFLIAIQLSGHSHGGQVRIPGLGAPILPYLAKKYPLGLQRAGDLWVYTNRGIGLIPPPVRINCRPEITLLTLKISNV